MLAHVEGAEIRNETSDARGPVVQAGFIHQVSVGGGPGRDMVPRQLPGAVRDFTGRTEYLTALDSLVPDDEPPDGTAVPGSVVITALDGAGGIGKTSLAVWWAHRVQHRFPDGTLHTNLRGYGPSEPATPGEALDAFLCALGVAAEGLPAGVDAKAALFRSLLADRRVLIVLDNANHPDQVRPLLPGSTGCVVVVTSRDSLTGLAVTDGAHRITLDLLTEPEAHALVTAIIGHARVAAEPDAVTELVRVCARLPLALRIAAVRVATMPHRTVAEVVADLRDARTRLDALSVGPDERTAVRAVFDWSYHRLTPEQASLFRLLGLHPGPEISVFAAAALTGWTPDTARRGMDELADAHLIEARPGGRYRFHDLLRAYAADRAHDQDTAHDRDEAGDRLVAWYAHTADYCDKLLYQGYRRLPYQLDPPAHQAPVNDLTDAASWLHTERENLTAALHYAAGRDLYPAFFVIALAFRASISWTGWEERVEVGRLATKVTQRSGDRYAEAFFRSILAETLMETLKYDEARAEHEQACAIARKIGAEPTYAMSMYGLGHLYIQQERFTEAITQLEQTLPIAMRVDVRTEALVESGLSDAHIGVGDYRQAIVHGERGRALRRRCGDRTGEAWVLEHNLARAWQRLDDHRQAIDLCRQAIEIGRAFPYLQHETLAGPLETMAQCLHQIGRTAEALSCWREAAAIYDQCGRGYAVERIQQQLRDAE